MKLEKGGNPQRRVSRSSL